MNNKTRNIVAYILLGVAAVCAIVLIINAVCNRSAENEVDSMKESFVVELTPEPIVETATPKPEDTEAPTATPGPTEDPFLSLEGYDVPARVIDFEGLKETAPDVYAWLLVPGTDIDYPIVQHPEEPEYYLRRTPEGKDATAGSIFTEMYNNTEWTDNNTIIYGHNMRNGSMFATLHNFEEQEFFEENQFIYIYSPDNTVRVYQVFGAYEFGDMHLTLTYGMNTEEGYGEFLSGLGELVNEGNLFREDVEVTTEDTIITLSTCVRGKDYNRFLVSAKLVAMGTME
ncbi:MAG: class B sortase [Lachnospiraceae bacterium]|nr:class B sortase [Lachnospiraceae bacterium]